MKTLKLNAGPAMGLLLICAALLLPGCAAKKNTWGDTRKGLILEYRMPTQHVLKYDLTSEFIMGMDVMGQEVDVTTNSRNAFSIQPQDTQDGNHRLQVVIDTLYMKVVSPRGEINPDMSSVIGHPFALVISPKGKELDFSEAEALKYQLGEYQELNVSSDFQTLFPNLPDKPVTIGDTWNSVDTVVEKSQDGYLRMTSTLVHTLEGYEVLAGYDCVKIQSVYQGNLEGESESRGIQMKTTGNFEGMDTWYFAYKEGLLLKNTSQGRAVTETKALGDKEIIIPGTRDFAVVTQLIDN